MVQSFESMECSSLFGGPHHKDRTVSGSGSPCLWEASCTAGFKP